MMILTKMMDAEMLIPRQIFWVIISIYSKFGIFPTFSFSNVSHKFHGSWCDQFSPFFFSRSGLKNIKQILMEKISLKKLIKRRRYRISNVIIYLNYYDLPNLVNIW